MEHDLMITGGTLVDGTGAEPIKADLAVTDGRITQIGDLRGIPPPRQLMRAANL